MKTALVLLLSLPAALLAADPQQTATNQDIGREPAGLVKKLGSFTWDVDAHKLIWVVQKGHVVNGEFKTASEERYEISPDEATMGNADEKRGFSDDEAASLQHLLDVLSVYCAESVVWWDEGQGTPVAPGSRPVRPNLRPGRKLPDIPAGEKPVKVAEPQPRNPAQRMPESGLIAGLAPAR